ncbi:MAG: ABC transporter ATP-binding protein [Bacteroidales bacterium]
MIEIKNIQFSYGKHKVLNNVTLELKPGKIYGLLGQNGVGKSTLLKIMSGLLKIKGGECVINNYQPSKREPSFLGSIYYLPEDFVGPNVIIQDYVMQVGTFYPNFSQERFFKIIAEFDVNPKIKFTKLSFGQQKKGIIALALSLGTDVLLMDEPSNGLDIPSKVILRRMIAENAMENQMVVISTHQVRDLENLIDPIIILDNDGILLNQSIQSISEKLEFALEPQKDTTALYSEPALNGYMTVRENKSGFETNVDLESLFNCTLANKKIIQKLF